MDTTNKHIGNILSRLSDRDTQEVFEQYMHKCEISSTDLLLQHLKRVLECERFDYEGNACSDLNS